MSTSLCTLGGVPAVLARVQVPGWGLWWADVDLTEAAVLAGPQALVLGNVTAQCAIVSGGAANGRASYRAVGGFGGWGKRLPAKPYQDDRGVAVSGILGDAAREAGEQIAGLPSTRAGQRFARAEGPAYDTLALLAPRAWYVDFEGVTRISARPTTAYAGSAPRVRQDPGAGVVEIATEQIADLVPGVTVDGSLPATDVEYVLTAKRLTARVYAGRRASRRLAAYARIMAALDPGKAYRAPREFRVVSQSGERVNLQPVRVASGMPTLAAVQVRAGLGSRCDFRPGSVVVVQFIDGDPSRPYVACGDAPDAPGYFPTELDLGKKSGAKALVVDGDTIDISLLVAPSGGGPVTGTAKAVASLTKIKAGE